MTLVLLLVLLLIACASIAVLVDFGLTWLETRDGQWARTVEEQRRHFTEDDW